MAGATLLVDHSETAVTVGSEDDRGNCGGIRPTSDHVGQEAALLFGEASHTFGVVLYARFEVIEGEAELAAEATELTPSFGEVAGDQDSETIHHHLSCTEARRL